MSGGREQVHAARISPEEARRRRDDFPAGRLIDFDTLERAGGEEVLDAVRESEPITWADPLGHWLVTGYELAREALRPRTPLTVDADCNVVRSALGECMLTVDGDEQRRMRTPFEEPFRMREVEPLYGAVIDGVADALIESFVGDGSCELGAAFAAPFAITVAGRIVGIDTREVVRIDHAYRAFAQAMTFAGDAPAQAAAAEARAMIDGLVMTGTSLGEGITAQAAAGPEALDEAEILAQMRVILFGAIETVQASILNTMYLLSRHPREFERVRGDQTLIGAAVLEALRLIPPVTILERWAAKPLTLGDVELAEGERIDISVIAANRDPGVFEDPTRFDLDRPNSRRGLAFAFGAHHCIGMHLAILETTRAIAVLLARLPNLRVRETEAPAGYSFRRSRHIVVGWDAG